MLILSRRVGERLIIAKDIIVTVAKIEGARVKLGFEAPKDTRIIREELDCKQGGDQKP